MYLPSDINSNFCEKDLNMDNMKMITAVTKRDHRYREKKVVQNTQKAENIKDMLKQMRGKLNSKEKLGEMLK